MTNIISNSIVVVDVGTNGGGPISAMVNTGPIFFGFAAIGVVVVSLVTLLVWLKKSK
jgi:hypothetical protein